MKHLGKRQDAIAYARRQAGSFRVAHYVTYHHNAWWVSSSLPTMDLAYTIVYPDGTVYDANLDGSSIRPTYTHIP